MDRLLKIEKMLRDFVEEAISGVFQTSTQSQRITRLLLDAMREGVELIDDGRILAPDRYELYLHPTSATRLRDKDPNLPDRLRAALRDDVRVREISFTRRPEIILIEDSNLVENGMRVEARISTQDLDSTKEMAGPTETQASAPPTGAFLIVDGRRHIGLSKPAMTIGRRQDNDLVLDDPRVSRIHAQLRVKDGRFALIDLGSSHGTRVNNRQVTQHILQAGDVIRLGSTRLVYGEDPSDPLDDTPTFNPPRENADVYPGSPPGSTCDASESPS
jgi:pSer/pThr/pTyr-binding forkhead associated (FHA) protein